jgi:GNAT superfamily N-acetyltransferase
MYFYHPILEQNIEKGFLSGHLKEDILFIENVFVLPEFRGQRLAAKAMAELVHHAIKNGMLR